MAINSIWNNNSPMDYLGFLSTDPNNNTEDNEWLTHFQQLVQEKLSEMNEDKDSAATVNPAEEIAKWKENIYNKMKNGETEESFQIGGQSFSMKEWDNLLDSFQKLLSGDCKNIFVICKDFRDSKCILGLSGVKCQQFLGTCFSCCQAVFPLL